MLRLIVVLLIVLNAGYAAWSQGAMRSWGWGPDEQREPQRVAEQVRPEVIRVIAVAPSNAPAATNEVAAAPTPAAVPAATSAPTPTLPASAVPVCLQAGPIDLPDAAQIAALRSALDKALPGGSWKLDIRVAGAARWIIYMGKFDNKAELERKRNQLSPRVRKALQELENPALQPGLSLARFATQVQAQKELEAMQQKGLRTAQVVQEWPERRQGTLRVQLDGASPSQAEALRTNIQNLTGLKDKAITPCGN
jgi:hypothetical protein